MSSKISSDTDPDGFSDPDTEIDAIDPTGAGAVSGEIDAPTDRHDIAAIHDPAPRDTRDDREKEPWLAAVTMPFARAKTATPEAPIRIESDTPDAKGERPMVGHRYLNYELRRRLARGSMGLVYEAHHLHLQRRVAIKFLSPALLSDENMVYRFLGEAQAMARIEHPGIPTIFDFGQDAAGNAYLIMDYLEGESLAAKLERGPLPYDLCLEVAAQTAEILAAAHAENIVHRDLKPENILLCDDVLETPEGPQPIVRLIDFGICKARSVDERAETAAGNLIGTPRYMSPEQTYSRAVTARTDVYALGCVIFELVCGRPPFAGKLAELVDAHRHNVPDDIRHHRPSASPKLAKLVALMLAKEATARPRSGMDLAAALRACKRPEKRSSGASARPHRESRRAALPTPRASTALSAIEDGSLSAERTPLPFHPVSPTLWGGSESRLPPVGSRSGREPKATGLDAIAGSFGTTQITISSGRLSWMVLILLCLAVAGLGLMLLSGTFPAP